MHKRFYTTLEQEETIYHSELFRYGVDYEKAAIAAKVLASKKPDELLTEEEKQLVTEACKMWLEKHKRLTHLNPLLKKYQQVK
ncbi:hypothetical protein F7734_32925 [Scytonema sp. UIC 10036]|uniref:hypothetical protein n=1 Tax=Scytonema sp. UIC 10036 TaxID=2304196 RepID=UPI0012DA26F0|nr:hypothetical protein [Scytonema sp. UIC 10036]MUG96889.1 hypothetical protein [Scytonema sp. UIC 10036]